MRKLIVGLPPRAEFAIVVLLAFGPFIASSFASLLMHPATRAPYHTNATLLGLLAYEAVLLVLLAAFLHARGWSAGKIGLQPTLKETGIGALLFVADYALWIAIWFATVRLSVETARSMAATQVVTHALSPFIAAPTAILNPLFEEIFVTGYVMTALKNDRSPWRAINASVLIRLLYHLYQGPLGVLATVPMGLIFAVWYARTGRLWPVIVAHALLDGTALLSAMRF
jgi:membrane protease YdiL (CAAX protease family)